MKNAGLNPNYTSKVRQEYLDYDYLDKLTEEEKDWLNRFTEENLNANFQHTGEQFYEDKEDKRKIYGENNARNRCAYSSTRAQGRLSYLADTFGTDEAASSKEALEEALVDYIDNKDED